MPSTPSGYRKLLRFLESFGTVELVGVVVSGEVVGSTKTRRVRRLTLGQTTVALWRASEATWRSQLEADCSDATYLGEWLFSRDLDHTRRLTASGMGHWFAQLCTEARLPGASLHRLRHTVATFLVGRGELLRAQHRLGHWDASTTLRNYAHAMPLEDESVADDLDQMLGTAGPV